MAPKKEKKVKKTKEELEAERILREEEEAKRIEEERIRAEEEQKRLEELERLRVEEAARNRAAELERLHAEYSKSQADIQERLMLLQSINSLKVEKETWEKYLACELRPNAKSEAEINSYINTWRGDTEMDMQKVTNACNDAYQIILDLVNVAAEAASVGDMVKKAAWLEFINQLKEIVYDKMDCATAYVLQHSDDFTDGSAKQEVKLDTECEWMKLGLWVNLVPKSVRNKRVNFEHLGIQLDLPKPIAVQSMAVRITHMPYDDMLRRNEALRERVLGGVFCLDILIIPPAPKKVKGWTLRELQNDKNNTVQRIAYPFEGNAAATAQPIKIQIRMPNEIVFADTPRVGWWDEIESIWKEDGITDVEMQPDTESLVFYTTKVKPLAILQDRNLHFSHLAWKLQVDTIESGDETMEHVGHFILQNSIYSTIHIEIRIGKCKLIEPKIDQIRLLNTEYFPPGEFFNRLSRGGINLTPTADDDAIFNYTPKVPNLEKTLVREICRMSAAFEISSHDLESLPDSWKSHTTNPSSAVLRVQPKPLSSFHDPTEMLIDTEPRHILAQTDEDAPGSQIKFRLDPKSGLHSSNIEPEDTYDSYSYLQNALSSLLTPDLSDRLEQSPVEFESTMRKLFYLIRPFSYCIPKACTKPIERNFLVPETQISPAEPTDPIKTDTETVVDEPQNHLEQP